ncbi:N-alpha-acetyltransferase 38, NatC auxiliary subunit isoform X1 [Wyeomyia smithii]|uniref:N-alpha-acetyltransferase 38, NatC auxiliary subunit isoform X1 n=1 Tax=Wyeomyia smithii TaxID=174621 RepID=UPI002467E419|nr:N-alpha-acetyltransferase 38, NatC auxiliary subunit isoform X1 [Wyeomyia smithii]
MSSDEKDSGDELWEKIQKVRNIHKAEVEQETNPSRKKLKSWLNNTFRIKMTDGRILIGMFVCTDADANVILGLTSEFTENGGEERVLGLVMIPGRYIVSIEIDEANLVNAN